VWWNIPVIPALGRQSQEDLELEGSQGYVARTCVKKQNKIKEENISFCF
jgi:hypothetical protein